MQDGSTVLVHGNSRVVVALLLKAAETKQFNVMVTEGRPNEDRYITVFSIFLQRSM
jgi:translation initiation factor eIF-2B subunit alpha